MERKLDLPPEEWERIWVEEAARRYQQLKAGTAKSIASDEVFARLDERGSKPSKDPALLPSGRWR